MKVLKFGGTSVATPVNINKVIDIVSSNGKRTDQLVVVSAFGGVTNKLIHASKLAAAGDVTYLNELQEVKDRHQKSVTALTKGENRKALNATLKALMSDLNDVLHGVFLVRELSPKSLDYIQGFGERLSSQIITAAFNERKVAAKWVDASALVKTDSSYGNARVQQKTTYTNIKDHFKKAKGIYIIPGFVATTTEGEYSTLGRGGSDYTAAIFAAAVKADVLEIWTDVDGVMTANPRMVPKAFPLPHLSYEEALELSYFGAKVIYPPTIQPALAGNIPILIKNSFNPKAAGTYIAKKPSEGDHPVRGITSINNIALLTISGSGMIGIPGTSMRLFGALGQNSISVIMISQASSEHSITIAVAEKDAQRAKEVIEQAFELEVAAGKINPVAMEKNLAIVAIVGQRMKNTPGIAGKLFSTLGSNGVNVVAIAQGTSELNISFVIRSNDEAKALNLLHESFFLSNIKTAHLFVAGVGLVGKAMLAQIKKQQQYLQDKLNIDIKLVAVSNSKTYAINEDGLSYSNWSTILAKAGKHKQTLAEAAIDLNLRNSIFVDCTASDTVAKDYQKLLDHNISVVAANKVASSSSQAAYDKLVQTARDKGVRYLYETNVGAGLPVLSTLNDLVKSGDQIKRIEAVLSGTMNFIFNTVSDKTSFSEAVKQAKAGGYTEPDPRIDLSGKDVARKILILAREAGFKLEPKAVKIENYLPANVFTGKTEAEFWKALAANDDAFEQYRSGVAAKGHKLRLVASFDGKTAKVGIAECDAAHPFYNLEGSDSIVLFKTVRYPKQPLVVKGAGAGAEVTAAGVFADIIRILN